MIMQNYNSHSGRLIQLEVKDTKIKMVYSVHSFYRYLLPEQNNVPLLNKTGLFYTFTQYHNLVTTKNLSMDAAQSILQTLKASGNPMSAGEIAEKTGIERKEVDKAMKTLKESGKITSPRRCYWTAK